MIQRPLRAMNCVGSIGVVVDPDTGHEAERGRRLLDQAIGRVHDLERRWSRFIADSELSRLNEMAGRTVRVSDHTVRLVTAMVQGWHATDGAFDPTLIGTLVELGYAQSRSDASARTALPDGVGPIGRPGAVLVDPARRLVRLPVGTAVDPGGIGKGLAADIVFEWLMHSGAAGAVVEIGGDLRAGGVSPSDGDGWVVLVDVALPGSPVTIAMSGGGVATSTSRLRTWQVEGARRHHLIDPRTLSSSATEVVSCTVVAGTGAWAETWTKCAFAMDLGEALEAYQRRNLAASLTTADGRRHVTVAWHDFERADADRTDEARHEHERTEALR
jgi:thiamine biosynthesis lipoprotein